MPSHKTILVLHLAGQYPMAGVVWQALQYVVGLRQLGHEVYYIEDSGAPPYDPQQGRVLLDGIDVRELTLASLRQQIAMVLNRP